MSRSKEWWDAHRAVPPINTAPPGLNPSVDFYPRQCFCVGPQDGNPLCPCQMRNVRVQNGRYVQIIDHGPAPKEYVGWTCGKCGAPVAGGFSKCDKCGRDPKAAPMTEAAGEQADPKDFQYAGLHGVEARRRFIQDHEPKPAEAPTLVEESLAKEVEATAKACGLNLSDDAPIAFLHALALAVDGKLAAIDRRLSQPATGAGGE